MSPGRNMQVIKPETLTCAQCTLYRYSYCQNASLANQFFTDVKGTCAYSADLNNPLLPAPSFNCSDMYFAKFKAEWLTFLPCQFFSSKCGSPTQLLNLTNNVTTINVKNMDQGDVCMYELNYNGTNNEFKLWVTE